MGHKAIIAVSTLRQQALDFVANRDRIIESIAECKRLGAKFRVGPELEITYGKGGGMGHSFFNLHSGYGCWDHFLEGDTHYYAWRMLADILQSGVTDGILCDIGM